MQVRLKELDTPRASTSTADPKFDISKQIRFVPPFQEKEVDKYFLHFEKIATSLEWPCEVWTLLLQSVLVGKAREVYLSLSMTVEQSVQYELVKSTTVGVKKVAKARQEFSIPHSREVPECMFAKFARLPSRTKLQ